HSSFLVVGEGESADFDQSGSNVLVATRLLGKISRIACCQPSTTLFGQQTTVNLLATTRLARTAASVLPAPVPDQLPTRFRSLTTTAKCRCIRLGGAGFPST